MDVAKPDINSWTTPDLCDSFPGQVQALESGRLLNFGGREAFSGEVETLACFEDNSFVKSLMAEPGRGRILVVDGGGSLRRALLGDQIAQSAAENDWSGLVIHGAVRDVEVLDTLNLGVKALAACPVRTEKRNLGDVGVELAMLGAHIRPGQFMYADRNGVVLADHKLD